MTPRGQRIRRRIGLGLVLLSSAAGLRAELAVSGRVFNPAGAPLAGCRVELADKPTGYLEGAELALGKRREALDRVETDHDGGYTVLAPGPGAWLLRVDCENRVEMTYQLLPLTEAVRVPPAILRDGGPLETRVVDADGRPVCDAIVVVHPDLSAAPWSEQALTGWRPVIRWHRSDAEGWARFLGVDGEILTAQAFARGHAFSRVEPVDGATVELQLRSGTRVEIVPEAPGEEELGSVLVRLGPARWPVTVLDEPKAFVFFALADRENAVWLETESGLTAGSVLRPATASATATLRLQRPRSIAGRVIDASTGEPVSGAVVWRESLPSDHAVTGAAGEWTLETIAQGPLVLRAEAAGFLPASASGPELEGTELRLEPGVSLTGRVLDALGQPVADAEILCSPEREPSLQRRAWSTDDGAFRCPVLPSGEDLHLEALRAGYAPAGFHVRRHEVAQEARIHLRRADRVHGRLLTAGGEPLAGAVVLASPVVATQDPAVDARRLTTEVETDRRGGFEFPHLPAGSYGLELAGERRAPRVLELFELREGVGEVDLGTLRLGPEVGLEGRVLSLDGVPIGGVRITVTGSDLPRPAATATGDDGAFELDGFRAGDTVEVEAAHPSFQDAAVSGLVLPPRAPLEIVLAASSTLTGTVLSGEHSPIASAKIELRSAAEPAAGPAVTAVSDETGAFVLRDLAPGAAWLEVRADGYLSRQTEVEVGNESGVSVVLDRGWSVEGMVLGAEGLPVSAATVTLQEKSREGTRDPAAQSSTSDDRGWFRISGLRPGEHQGSVRHPDYPELVEVVEVPAQGSGLRLVLDPGTRVAGRVLDAEGSGVPAAHVILRPATSTGREQPQVSTDGEGSFELAGVAAGDYRLLVEKEGYATGFYPGELHLADAPIEDLVVHLNAGAEVHGRVLGLDSDELARLSVSVFHPTGERRTARTEIGGGYVIDRLSPGEWALHASAEGDDRTLQRSLTIGPGDRTLELDLVFERGVRLSGEIVVDDAPLGGARILLQGGGLPTQTVRTVADSSGRFELRASEPGRYLLTVLDSAGVVRHREMLSLTRDLHRGIVQGTGSLSGRLLLRGGSAPARGARVLLRPLTGDGPSVLRVTETGPEGRFTFDKLAAGEYQLEIKGLPGPAPAALVRVGTQEDLGDLKLAE